MVWKRAALILFAGVLLPACIDDVEDTAVTLSETGDLRALHHPCRSGNVVSALQLRLQGERKFYAGDDRIMWKVIAIDTRTERKVEAFEPERIPGGYRETVPFAEPSEGAKVVVDVETRHGGLGASIPFVWGTLAPGTLVTMEGVKTRSEWLEYAIIEGCGGTGAS